jgi:hypothetical protein
MPTIGIRVIGCCVGSFLIAATMLKFSSLLVSTLPQSGWITRPEIQIIVAQWELILGIALILGVAPRLIWGLAVITFRVFAIVSGYLGFLGVATCGCFGNVPASPWLAFGIDLSVLSLLGIAFPRKPSTIEAQQTGQSPAISTMLLSMLFLGFFAYCGIMVAASWIFGSWHAAVAWGRNDPVYLIEPFLDLGLHPAGSVVEREFYVRNGSDHPIHLLGGPQSCSCMMVNEFPILVEPKSLKSLHLRFVVPGNTQGFFVQHLQIGTTASRTPVMRLQITGQAIFPDGVADLADGVKGTGK